jgi:hypothetical protein
VTQVKFLSTYLKAGLEFILVTEIQDMAIIIGDTKKKVIYHDFTLVTET